MSSKEFFFSNILFILAFTLSASLIMTLAIVNDGSANDDHIQVAELIIEKGKVPEHQDCWQCYHPKLYHQTVAKLWTFFKVKKRENRVIVAQVVNAIAGILTLFICLIFILKQPFKKPIQLLCFSLVALNPRFIAISAQASNDAFLILFGTIILFFLSKFVEKSSIKYFSIILITTILACLTKGNSFVLMTGVIVVFILKIASTKNFKFRISQGYLGGLILYVLLTFLFVGYFGSYYDNYKKYDNAFVYNTPIGGVPDFLEKTTFRRPGVQSIVDGYFTFRFFDLVKNPMISNDYEEYPMHRTSVWSQLYGRTHFLYFDNWPPGDWQSSDAKMMDIGRMTFVLALLPTLLFFIGFLKNIKKWSTLFFRRNLDFLNKDSDWIFDVFALGFLAFIILFTAYGRDYSFIKIIYLFPAILATLIPLMKGLKIAFNYLEKNRMLQVVFQLFFVALLLLYIIPVLDLISNLMESHTG